MIHFENLVELHYSNDPRHPDNTHHYYLKKFCRRYSLNPFNSKGICSAWSRFCNENNLEFVEFSNFSSILHVLGQWDMSVEDCSFWWPVSDYGSRVAFALDVYEVLIRRSHLDHFV